MSLPWLALRSGRTLRLDALESGGEARKPLGDGPAGAGGGGVLWLFTGRGPAPSEPIPLDALLQPNTHVFTQSVVWNVHWTRVMENMLDSPHVAFVHTKTFGGPVARRLKANPDARLVMRFEPHEHGGRIAAIIEGEERPAALDYRFPNLMELTLDAKGRLFRILAVCIPLSQNETRLMLVTARLPALALARLAVRTRQSAHRRGGSRHRQILSAAHLPSPEQEKSLPTDAPTLAFRRIYRQKLLGSRS